MYAIVMALALGYVAFVLAARKWPQLPAALLAVVGAAIWVGCEYAAIKSAVFGAGMW